MDWGFVTKLCSAVHRQTLSHSIVMYRNFQLGKRKK